MPSPFPGMDPYIEASGRWGDFHLNMLAALRDALNARLPEGFVAENDLQIWVEDTEPLEEPRPRKPDLYVTEKRPRAKAVRGAAAVLGSKPKRLLYPRIQRKKHRNLRVLDLSTNNVVTVLELLSPSNKTAGKDRDAYLVKREEYLANWVNFIEIDLLRGGARLPHSPAEDAMDYYLLVSRFWEFPRMDYWPFGLRDPFPPLPVPLAKDLPDVLLPLRPCVDRVYDEGKYQPRIYDCTLNPRPGKKDAAWIQGLLAGTIPDRQGR